MRAWLLIFALCAACDRGAAPEPPEGPCGARSPKDCARAAAADERAGDLERAAARYRAACDADLASACNGLGYLYGHGIGFERDPARARQLYDRACEGGDPTGCANLAWTLERGVGGEADITRAETLYERACEAGAPMACAAVGEGLLATERERGLTLLTRACDGGSGEACVRLGLERPGEAPQRFLQACEAGVGAGCFNAALDADATSARSLYEAACDLEHMPGCHNLALLLESEQAARARVLYQRACDADVPEACLNLGVLYNETLADPERGAHFLRRACEAGVLEGCEALGALCADHPERCPAMAGPPPGSGGGSSR